MINYNLRILRESNYVLHSLVQSGVLKQVSENVPGASGTVFKLTENPDVLSHFQFKIGQQTLQAQLYVLPPEEYAGLVTASPRFAQFDVAHLLPALTQPMDSLGKEAWLQQLVQALQAEAQVTPAPHLLADQHVTPAPWVPERTRIFQNDSGWFLSLFFERATVQTISGIERSAVGIDVGLNTLAVAVHRTGLVHRAAGISEVCITANQLEEWCPGDHHTQCEVQRHLLLLQHAAARLELQEMVRLLLSSASFVYFENLQYPNCSRAFARRSRELGLRDFLMCWLPKRLDAAGIRWQRVPPEHTSQFCNLTHLRGERDSSNHKRFLNGNGTIVDADVNAAHNIIAVGMAYRLERGL
ncbi:zinc ribbon domain-containing protein [Deinococcus fonticola]|uniref:zinc ribbon domain-containing protein n=1 Tax=Deinococcus fonticola TaxID=2528713 RepID=UPI00107585E6|nr:hypothetical protein [Deinococcus fonticola]